MTEELVLTLLAAAIGGGGAVPIALKAVLNGTRGRVERIESRQEEMASSLQRIELTSATAASRITRVEEEVARINRLGCDFQHLKPRKEG